MSQPRDNRLNEELHVNVIFRNTRIPLVFLNAELFKWTLDRRHHYKSIDYFSS